LISNGNYFPSITILVPTYNEANLIEYKLENLYRLKYPKTLIQIIVVDSGSTDGTVNKVSKFIENHPDICMKILKEYKRGGKSKALNLALKYASGDVIVVSDADSFLPSDILLKSLPKLSDPSVGAIGGREVLLNLSSSWVTVSEEYYLKFMDIIKQGESKIHSTIFFEGGFSAYKRKYLDSFDDKTGSDDCGTALDIVQKGVRTIFAPEAAFYTVFPTTLRGKLTIKIRRSNQLVRVWMKCLRIMLSRKLLLPKKIAMLEIFSFLVNPLIYALVLFTTIILVLQYLPIFLISLLILLPLFLISRIRFLFLNGMLSYFILLGALLALLFGKKFTAWEIPVERKKLLTKEMLKSKDLI
jgi:cellulose synthase/poly-beta-1,6-N-acetylglucosamine synthase-like glycosyltransferase